jgi:aromatic ring-opening dioxygenase catalytic subunit (LigB family)
VHRSLVYALCWPRLSRSIAALLSFTALASVTPFSAATISASASSFSTVFDSTVNPTAARSMTDAKASPTAAERQPVLFLSHGGGPSFFLDVPPGSPMYDMSKNSASATWMKNLTQSQQLKPRALLVFSAHWESDRSETVLINRAPKHSLYYDYGGFPEFTYHFKWSPPGDPALAEKVAGLLQTAGFKTAFEDQRGLDHGVFVPLMLAYPKADIPIVQVSLLSKLDPEGHLRLGHAVAALREEGVLIVTSGFTTHSFHSTPEQNLAFANWLAEVVAEPSPQKRWDRLKAVSSAPYYRQVHPRSEHLLPVHIAAGTGGDDAGSVIARFDMDKGAMGCLHCYRFG